MNFSELATASALTEPDSTGAPTTAWLGHIPFGSWLVQASRPQVLVELGTHYGDSYFAFCKSIVVNGLNTQCYAVDTWQGDEHAGEYSDEVFDRVRAHHDSHYSAFSNMLRMRFEEAVTQFSDGSVDLLHIDGLHTYEAVKNDFDTWLPKLSSRAIVLFHDTNVREGDFGVWRLWDELSAQYPNMRFDHSHGLGVLFVGSQQAGPVQELLKLWSEPEGQSLIRQYFSRLGQGVLDGRQKTLLTQRLAERDARVVALSNDIADVNGVLQERSTRVATLDVAVAELRNELAARDTRIVEMDAQIAELHAQIAELNGEVHELNLALEDRANDIARLNQAVAHGNAIIQTMHDSKSWRMTRPLRFAGDTLRRCKHSAKRIATVVQHSGGIQGTVEKAAKVYRKEGLQGVKRNLRVVAVDPIVPAAGSSDCDRNDYKEWVSRYDTMTDETRNRIRARINTLDRLPLISVVMPTYNPKPEWLIEVIESVRNQLYPTWQLCIADDASPDTAIRPLLESYARKDPRIKIVFREQNGHISAASNSALDLVSGEWVALLDHDDLLPEHALFWVADAINQHPEAELIYSDEDKIDEQGGRFSPYFKCDWNEDLFYSHNLISHLGVYRTELVRKVGGFRVGLEGSQDHDLALRCIEGLRPDQVHHIPRVLYHWRIHAESTAHSAGAKPYAMLAGERALTEHFERLGVKASVQHMGAGYRVSYALPDVPPLVSIVIPTRNGVDLLRQCVQSIVDKTSYSSYEILIVDNGSDDPATLQYLQELGADSCVRVIRDDGPFNYSALNNEAVGLAQGSVIALLNNDIEVISPDWLSEMVSYAIQPGIGAVGAKLYYPNDTLQHGGVILGIGGIANHAHKQLPRDAGGYFGRAAITQGFSAVTAACLVVRKDVYLEVGGLNDVDLKVAFNDVDFCLRVREAGYRNVWTPYAELYHHESATRGIDDTPEKRSRFSSEIDYMQQRWGTLLASDPAYSPNLTRHCEDFSLAWPPRVPPID